MTRALLKLTAPLAVLLTQTACVYGFSASQPSSHFAYPNSNVRPIGEATGKRTKLCGLLFFNVGTPNLADQEMAVSRALQSSNGDMLLDMQIDSKQFLFPYLFSTCTTRVYGTAATMEIGTQQLIGDPAP